MRAVLYLRVSTDEQTASGAGLAAQTDACHAHAARSGWEVGGTFGDEGVGGGTGLDKRPGLLDAIATLEAGDVLLVAKRDRLGRDPIAVAMIEAAVARRRARVVSAAGEGTADDDPTSVLMRRVVDAFAEYERLVIKARTRSALAAKRRRSERTGRVPYGSDLVDDGRRSKTSARPCGLAPNPGELAAVALIRELRAAGRSLRQIAAELDRRGVPTKGGGARWSHTSIVSILARESRHAPDQAGPIPGPPRPESAVA